MSFIFWAAGVSAVVVVVLQPPNRSQQPKEWGGMDGPSLELCWVDTWPAEVPDQLQTVWGQWPVAGDRDIGNPDKGKSVAAHHIPCLCWVLGMRCRPGASSGTNSKGTITSVPKASVFEGRITKTMSAFGYKGSWATEVKPLLVPGELTTVLEDERWWRDVSLLCLWMPWWLLAEHGEALT